MKPTPTVMLILAALLVMPAPLSTSAQESAAEPGDSVDVPLPLPRPESFETESEPAVEEEDTPDAVDAAPDTIATEARVYQEACPAVLDGSVIASLLEPIDTQEGCGLQSPWQLEAVAVAGRTIPLSGSPVMNCAMATELAGWVERADRTAAVTMGSGIAAVATGPGYACRLRNNADAGFISEHGLGNAADISGVTLLDGQSVTVRGDWGADSAASAFLEQVHAEACTRFTTVLGPEANADHEDHLHFDLGCHGGACLAQTCE